jgi:tRNA dimethylallyltransferase
MDKNKTLHVITGPTASGKTKKAVDLAKIYNTEIVSADSRQVYKELNVGVARPDLETLSQVQHHLIAHTSIKQSYDVAIFEREAISTLEGIFKNHDNAILVGGTGLYIDAVINGLDPIPDIDPAITSEVLENLHNKGLPSLLEELSRKDPDYFQQVDQANSRRVVRAIEVIRQTGRPFSQLRLGTQVKRPFETKIEVIDQPRAELYERINTRVDEMINLGLEQEVQSLYKLKNLKAMDTVGYREWWPYFEGQISYNEVIDKIKQHTRNYAKRQITWMKKYI